MEVVAEKSMIRSKKESQSQAHQQCNYCGSTKAPLFNCECFLVRYCNAECQEKDRKRHEETCKSVMNKGKALVVQAKRFKIRPPARITSSSSGGVCGLQNLGNTCFMNSSIQCLSNVYELTEFLLSNNFLADINEKNPLGTGGKLIAAYSELLKDMWEGSERYVSPWQLKSVVGKFASQFSGYSQQDSQELLSYLLDGIHEDLNRVRQKPYIGELDYKGQPDDEFAELFWRNHLARNNSVITELFTGQFKSRVKCPDCPNVSVTFDPFNYISLPIPNKEFVLFSFYLIFRDSSKTPLRVMHLSLSTSLDPTAVRLGHPRQRDHQVHGRENQHQPQLHTLLCAQQQYRREVATR